MRFKSLKLKSRFEKLPVRGNQKLINIISHREINVKIRKKKFITEQRPRRYFQITFDVSLRRRYDTCIHLHE